MSVADQNLSSVTTYLAALDGGNREAIAAMLDDDAVEVIPLSNTGSPDPWLVFTGKDEVLGYVDQIIGNFSQVRFRDPVFTLSADGDAVFFEARGDLVTREGSRPYHNVYVVKFAFRDGRIVGISEYANPITFAQLMGTPIG